MKYLVVSGLTVVTLFIYILWHHPKAELSVAEFLEQHWRYPLEAQGTPPETLNVLEASLAPESCGVCHTEQYRLWSESHHSHTMGSGILWQLQMMDAKHSRECLKCHAPLTEQFALLAQERGWSRTSDKPPDYIPMDLHLKGLVCAACHLRQHQRFGPPASKTEVNREIHGGFIEHKAFSDSLFCATCHQFPEDGPRLNGKLREDTYNQWRVSRYGEEGKECQSCHMPQLRHEWKGIHDEQMTRSAMSVVIETLPESEDGLRVLARVTNSGAGHHLPTYLVPELELLLELVSPIGSVRELARHTLAWRADLALAREAFDQRLPAGESVTLDGLATQQDGVVRLRVKVSPRHQYLVTFIDYLQNNRKNLNPTTRKLLVQAIQEARAAEYEFIAAEYPLAGIAN
ncbi:MAG: hypothetical protein HQL49_00855 [Gammaproteobacteria bacterium]|nr:hypothetical protein [Gammaproteobacteria bacterium]